MNALSGLGMDSYSGTSSDKTLYKAAEDIGQTLKVAYPVRKVILLGDARTGKTSTKKSLQKEPFDPNEPQTFGGDADVVKASQADDNWHPMKEDDPTSSRMYYSATIAAAIQDQSVPRKKTLIGSITLLISLLLLNVIFEFVVGYVCSGHRVPFWFVVAFFVAVLVIILKDTVRGFYVGFGLATHHLFSSDLLYGSEMVQQFSALNADPQLPHSNLTDLLVTALSISFGVTALYFLIGLSVGSAVFSLSFTVLCFCSFPLHSSSFTRVFTHPLERLFVWLSSALGCIMVGHFPPLLVLLIMPFLLVMLISLSIVLSNTSIFLCALAFLSVSVACLTWSRFLPMAARQVKGTLRNFNTLVAVGIIIGLLYVHGIRLYVHGIYSEENFSDGYIYLLPNTTDYLFNFFGAWLCVISLLYIHREIYQKLKTGRPNHDIALDLCSRRDAGLPLLPSHYAIFDFGGDEIYRIIHQVFLSQNAIYIITFSLSDVIKNSLDWQVERLFFWIDSILSTTQDSASAIFLVGTHRKSLKMTEVDAIVNNITKKIANILKKRHGRYIPIERNPNGSLIFTLDNRERNDNADLPHLLRTIWKLDCLKRASPVPAKWLYFNDFLKKGGLQKAIVPFDELRGYFETAFQSEKISGCSMTRADVREMLKFYDCYGHIRYFQDPLLQHYVCVDPQLIVKCTAALLSSPTLRQELAGECKYVVNIKALREELRETLHDNDYPSNSIEKCPFSLLLAVLDRVNIVVSMDQVEYPLCEDESVNYLLPFLLPSAPVMESFPKVDLKAANAFYFMFSGVFEEKIFHRLIGLCSQFRKLRANNRNHLPSDLRKDFAMFTIDGITFELAMRKLYPDDGYYSKLLQIVLNEDSRSQLSSVENSKANLYKVAWLIDTLLDSIRKVDFPTLHFSCGLHRDCSRGCRLCLCVFAKHGAAEEKPFPFYGDKGASAVQRLLTSCNEDSQMVLQSELFSSDWPVDQIQSVVSRYNYPVYVSCCSADRQWVTETLLPSIELSKRDDSSEAPELVEEKESDAPSDAEKKSQTSCLRRISDFTYVSRRTDPSKSISNYTAADINREYIKRATCCLIIFSVEYLNNPQCMNESRLILQHRVENETVCGTEEPSSLTTSDCWGNEDKLKEDGVLAIAILRDDGSVLPPEWKITAELREDSEHFYERLSFMRHYVDL